MQEKNLVIGIYSHPEYYPPTLSAIQDLAPLYKKIYVVHGNSRGFDWVYPENVVLIGPSKIYQPEEVMSRPVWKKIGWFLNFTRIFYSALKEHKADTILLYDVMPVLSYRLMFPLLKIPRIIWYHNHDVTEAEYIRKYSLGWWAWQSEKWIFPKLDLFSLPAVERKKQFPMERLKGQFIFLPNIPSIHFYKKNESKELAANKTIRLLFQGSIGTHHGLEEIIPLLSDPVRGHRLHLVLKGFISPEYLKELISLAKRYGVEKQVTYKGPSGYGEVITNASTCDIGIGIHKKQDIMNQTLGTASNKIYEYAASGMPVLVYDNLHFRQTLEKYSWIVFTDVTYTSLEKSMNYIIEHYETLSKAARLDFEKTPFEHYFETVKTLLMATDGKTGAIS